MNLKEQGHISLTVYITNTPTLLVLFEHLANNISIWRMKNNQHLGIAPSHIKCIKYDAIQAD